MLEFFDLAFQLTDRFFEVEDFSAPTVHRLERLPARRTDRVPNGRRQGLLAPAMLLNGVGRAGIL